MHPTETLINLIRAGIKYNVQGLKSVLFAGENVNLQDLPVAIIEPESEDITPYHGNYYLVDLNINIKYMLTKEHDGVNKILSIISACDQIIRDTAGCLSVNDGSATDLEQSTELEKTILTCSKNYILQYKRTRGF